MTTTLSSKGQIVLPERARNQLRLTPGTKLVCEVRGGTILLKPQPSRRRRVRHVLDPVSGLRVAQRTPGRVPVTSDHVKSLMAEFP